ncbi:MAG: fumarate hydratase [Candidatus Aureabacteria bacterium]|nr:fumarate hydratase [Candidatus Auribacterota bacterium]
MKKIKVKDISRKISEAFIDINYNLSSDVISALKKTLKKETSSLGRFTLRNILVNAELAGKMRVPLCQDCGLAVVYVEAGEDVSLDGSLVKAINNGVKDAYKKGYLRKSVCDPVTRRNTNTNLPPLIHVEYVKGKSIRLYLMSKGGGSENKSRLKMLTPSDGIDGIEDFICETVELAGASACPPFMLGVGIGGSFDKVTVLAKKALFRRVGSKNKKASLQKLESRIFKKVNSLGIGPGGFGGKTTTLAVHIEMKECHIASLPVAVNINCHSSRYKCIKL